MMRAQRRCARSIAPNAAISASSSRPSLWSDRNHLGLHARDLVRVVDAVRRARQGQGSARNFTSPVIERLNPLSALWTTPYGYALIAKLCVVGIVFGLGAWNWQRVGPSLGTEGGALKIRRTASTELAFAALVLLLTAILVSLPSPKAQKRSTTTSSATAT